MLYKVQNKLVQHSPLLQITLQKKKKEKKKEEKKCVICYMHVCISDKKFKAKSLKSQESKKRNTKKEEEKSKKWQILLQLSNIIIKVRVKLATEPTLFKHFWCLL